MGEVVRKLAYLVISKVREKELYTDKILSTTQFNDK